MASSVRGQLVGPHTHEIVCGSQQFGMTYNKLHEGPPWRRTAGDQLIAAGTTAGPPGNQLTQGEL